jgi:hypothetical protein
MRTGIANSPLHYGKAPPWLFQRMKKLARCITLAIVEEFGVEELLRRLSDPFWFQAFGCLLGFDWHSSGLTTTVCGALKEGIRGIEREIGFFVAGGKGSVSRKTPDEIRGKESLLSINSEKLIYASRMAAKVDSAAVQDGYEIYHHTFFFTADGRWAVVQQGMNVATRYARRYHWLSDDLSSFVLEPHKAIYSQATAPTLNMVARESQPAQEVVTSLACSKPHLVEKELLTLQSLSLPRRHELKSIDFDLRRLKAILVSTHESQPKNFENLLGIKGVGARTIRALALVSELVYGVKPSFKDPARFSFAHGGKDGHPYPVNRRDYDLTINFLEKALTQAKLGRAEKIRAFQRLAKLIKVSDNS